MIRNTNRLLRTSTNTLRYSLLNRSIASVTAKSAYLTKTTEKDPYQYQVGFGNRFASEAVPGTLPQGQNQPQKNKFDLYTEVLSGTAFVAPRHQNQSAFLYRIRPSVSHLGFTPLPDNPDLESNFFPLNPKIHINPTQLSKLISMSSWNPFSLPEGGSKVDLISGIKTLAGSGDPTLNEGQAIHIYTANSSMDKRAVVNADGDMLFVPQLGRLDIQTEFGHMMVSPGEICVIQKGIRFKVCLPDGNSRGYIQEIYGSHFELPELGPLGTHGLANARDFESPVASFDVDQSPWEIVYKLGGKLFSCKQNHTPFDVVAFHGNYIPYKYDLAKFISVGSVSKDHMDPSIYCALTAKSKTHGVALTDFMVFRPRWDVATETYRPAYYHRNSATEFLGIIEGAYGGREDGFAAGGASYQSGHIPHGGAYNEFKAASEMPLEPMWISEGVTIFMMESVQMLTVTDYALGKTKPNAHNPETWDKLEPQFLKHIDSVNKALKDNQLSGLKE